MKKVEGFKLEYTGGQDESSIREEIRRRLFLGKISPQAAKVMLEDFYKTKKIWLETLRTYEKVGQSDQITREITEQRPVKALSEGK